MKLRCPFVNSERGKQKAKQKWQYILGLGSNMIKITRKNHNSLSFSITPSYICLYNFYCYY